MGNRPRETAGIRSSRIKRVSMSGGKLQIQQKDSDDEEEFIAILEGVNQNDDGAKDQGDIIGNNYDADGADIGDSTCNKSHGIDIYGNEVSLQILGSDDAMSPIKTEESGIALDVDSGTDEGGKEEHRRVNREPSDYLE